jgi:regulatory subunit for Cdc7p protein kinase
VPHLALSPRSAVPHSFKYSSLHDSMASVSILSPHATVNMPSHRAPLRDAPSAVLNSPMRGASTALLGAKRQRQPTASQGENSTYHDSQMSKRRFVETDEPNIRLHGLPPKRSTQATSLQRRLEAARAPAPTAHSRSKSTVEQNETIRQWQKHYRKLFPTFVFYFDNVQDDTKRKFSAQIRMLGGVSLD